jgi:hypothetical protein
MSVQASLVRTGRNMASELVGDYSKQRRTLFEVHRRPLGSGPAFAPRGSSTDFLQECSEKSFITFFFQQLTVLRSTSSAIVVSAPIPVQSEWLRAAPNSGIFGPHGLRRPTGQLASCRSNSTVILICPFG